MSSKYPSICLDLNDSLEQKMKIKQTEFPINVFPDDIIDIIMATHESLKFPKDYIAASMLYASSLAIGNTNCVEVKNGWVEYAVIYMAIIGRAGTNKSHPLSFSLDPLIKMDNKTFADYEEQKIEFERASKLTKKERLFEGVDEPMEPVLKKFIVSDITPESLTHVHRFNIRGIGVYVDELIAWFKNFNRYNSGSEQEFWLSNWSGKPVIIDRKTSDSIRITKPFISVCGTIQTPLLDEMAKDNRSLNGFTDRILFVFPSGLKKEKWSEIELDQVYVNSWREIVNGLLSIELKLDEVNIPVPNKLKYTDEARELMIEWQNINTDLCNNEENDAIKSIYTKLEIYCIRFSLILHLLENICGNEKNDLINVDTVRNAIRLNEYFRETSVKVNELLSNKSPLDKLAKNKQQYYDALPTLFRTQKGVEIAANFKIKERSAKEFLTDKKLFIRIKHGEYEKLL